LSLMLARQHSGEQKKHPHAHSPGNLKGLKCYENSYFTLTSLYHHRTLKIYNQGNYLGSKFWGSRLPAQLISRQVGMKSVERSTVNPEPDNLNSYKSDNYST